MGSRGVRVPLQAHGCGNPRLATDFRPMSETPASPSRPSAGRLLILNAIFPGLGHLVAGAHRTALLLALPVIVLVAIGLVAVIVEGPKALAARFMDPAILLVLLGIQAVLLLWRLAALGAVRFLRPFRATTPTILAALVALVIVVGPSAYAANVTVAARDAALEIFQPVDSGGAWVPDATPPPVEPSDPDFEMTSPSPDASASAAPSDSPSPTPSVPRVNVLLIGMDSGAGRTTALTDTMIVASLDPVGKTVSMVSIARDTVDVPLPDGRSYRGKINSLVSYVRWHLSKFPGAKDGQSVLAAALGELLGIKIDMWAQVNLDGFVYLVDSVGGVNINVTDGFCDPRYKEYGISGFSIAPGYWHFNGYQALAYARVRKAAGESDFTRAARQQEVVAALRDRLVEGAFLADPARFLRSLGQTIKTNIPPSFIADWIDVASEVTRKDVFRVVFAHPYVKGGYDDRGSIQIPNMALIRKTAAALFTEPGVRPEGFDTMPDAGSGKTKNPGTTSTCGITPTPKPTATPKPTPKPTPAPTPTPSPTPDAGTPTPEPPTPSPVPTPTPAG